MDRARRPRPSRGAAPHACGCVPMRPGRLQRACPAQDCGCDVLWTVLATITRIAVREESRSRSRLGGVFDRDDGAVSLAAAHNRKRLQEALVIGAGRTCTGRRDLVDSLFGKSTEGSNTDADLSPRRRAGNVRRHSVKEVSTRDRVKYINSQLGALWPTRRPDQGEFLRSSTPAGWTDLVRRLTAAMSDATIRRSSTTSRYRPRRPAQSLEVSTP